MSDPDPKTGAALFVNSLDEVAAALGTTERQWRTYAKRDGFPKKIAGKGYDLEALAQWKAANIQPKSTGGELADLKAEKLKGEIELNNLRIAREKRLMVERAAVDELHARLALKLRAFLYSKLENEMPPKLAGCDALAIRKYGRTLADEIVTALARDVEQWSGE